MGGGVVAGLPESERASGAYGGGEAGVGDGDGVELPGAEVHVGGEGVGGAVGVDGAVPGSFLLTSL